MEIKIFSQMKTRGKCAVVSGILFHLLENIVSRYVSTIRTKKISLHSRRDDSSNWYERLNESDNIDNAKICVMNTIDKGKASFWQRYCCVYTRASLAIISASSHLLKLITQYVKTCPRFSLIPAHRFYSIVSYCNLTQSDR